MNVSIRPLDANDQPFLWEMLYEVVYVPEGEPAPPLDIVNLPEIACYLQDWGRPGDGGLIAVESGTGRRCGAAWVRLFTAESPGYGFVDAMTPELAMAVVPGCRGRGIGTSLMEALLASPCGASRLSLSVAAGNPALRLYRRYGFEVAGIDGDSFIMLRLPGAKGM